MEAKLALVPAPTLEIDESPVEHVQVPTQVDSVTSRLGTPEPLKKQTTEEPVKSLRKA